MRESLPSAQPNRYDRISPWYDALAFLVFWGKLRSVQRDQIESVPETADILIIGGGTGWLLESIFRARPLARVWYVEESMAMIRRAQRRNIPHDQVTFVHGGVESIPGTKRFDVAMLNFFLDQFSDTECLAILSTVKEQLHIPGTLCVADFGNTRIWHRWMLRVMYLFFRKTTGLGTTRLPDWYRQAIEAGYHEKSGSERSGKFVRNVIFKNVPDSH